MLRGFLIGSISALALSTVVLAGTSLLLPAPEMETLEDENVSALPQASVERVQVELVPIRPTPQPPADRASVDTAVDTAPAAIPQQQDTTPRVPPAAAAPSESVAVDAVPLPAGSQFNRPPEDRDVVTPDLESGPRQVAADAVRPGPAGPSTAPRPNTSSAALPATTQTIVLAAPPIEGAAPVLPARPGETAPRTFGRVQDQAETAPIDVELPSAPDAQLAEGRKSLMAEATIRIVPEDEVIQAPPAEPIDAPRIEALQQEVPVVPELEPRRLMLDSEREAEAASDAEAADDDRAIVANAVAFEGAVDAPIMAVVLMDGDGAPLDLETLASLDFPVTIAIDPTRPGASEAAERYRAAGYEILVRAEALALRGAAQDIEIGLGGILDAVPQAVGILDSAGGGFAGNRTALGSLLPALADAGLGFVAYPGRLNSGVAQALRQGVPAGTIYRLLDDEGEKAPVIQRYLDRSAFEAAQGGSALVLGRATSQTITALLAWQLAGRSDEVVIAPASHVLRRMSGQGGAG